MARILVFSLADNAKFRNVELGTVVISTRVRSLTFPKLTRGVLRALKLLASRKSSEETLEQTVIRTDGFSQLATLYYCINCIDRIGALNYTVMNGREPLVTIFPSSPNYTRIRPSGTKQRKKYVLSRFAYVRRQVKYLILESPLSHSTVIIHSRRTMDLLNDLAVPSSFQKLLKRSAGLNKQTLKTFLELLVRHQFIENDAKQNDVLEQWEFHDLLFHSRSRGGRTLSPLGASYRFKAKFEPLPAAKPNVSEGMIPLFKPETETFRNKEPLFSCILEKRESIRDYDENNPITAEQLGEFLFRAGRTKKIYGPDPERGVLYQIAARPYPGGGACYELELYLTIRKCRGISAGFFHYDSHHHRLNKISDPSEGTERLLLDAYKANGQATPQVLITIAARFGRVSWKYQGMAYATILKDVGVLYQTMYLVATAMGLAPCALGAGDSELFAKIAGTDYYAETSVGEFMLGSRISSSDDPVFR